MVIGHGFQFIRQPLVAAKLLDDDHDFDISEFLTGYYRRVDMQPVRSYKLSKEAFKIYQNIYDQLEQQRVNHPEHGLRAVYSKMEGQIGRFALNLHILHEIESGKSHSEISEVIPPEIILKAVDLANFYLNELYQLHKDAKAELGDLEARLKKVLDFAIEKKSVTANDVTRKFKFCKSNTQAKQILKELELLNKGSIVIEGRSFKFNSNPNSNPCNNEFYILKPIPNKEFGEKYKHKKK